MRDSAGLWLLGLALLSSPSAAGDEPLPGIVFVSDDIFGARHEAQGLPRHGTSHWREGYLYHRATTQHPLERTTTPTRPGRNLYTLVPAGPTGTLTRITHLTDGEVFDPEPSFDGRTILFSMRRDGEDWFNLYEIHSDGSGLVQLTDGPFNDVSGVYLPDGRIVFVSDRAGYLEEYHEERAETLWIMQADGSGIEQLTFNPGVVFDPTVLGRRPHLVQPVGHLPAQRPAGRQARDLSHDGPARRDRRRPFLRRGRAPVLQPRAALGRGRDAGRADGGRHASWSRPSWARRFWTPPAGVRPCDALWPVFPCATSVQLGGATHRVHLSPVGSRSTPYPLPDGRFLLSATLPGERDLGIYLADPQTRELRLVFNDPQRAEFDARPILLERPRPRVVAAQDEFQRTGPPRHRPASP